MLDINDRSMLQPLGAQFFSEQAVSLGPARRVGQASFGAIAT